MREDTWNRVECFNEAVLKAKEGRKERREISPENQLITVTMRPILANNVVPTLDKKLFQVKSPQRKGSF